MRGKIITILIILFLAGTIFRGYIIEITKREIIKQEAGVQISPDLFESLKNAPFLNYIGVSQPQANSLTCYGSHLETHLPLEENGVVYPGLSFVGIVSGGQSISYAYSVGDPLAAFGYKMDEEVYSEVSINSQDFEIITYPHMIVKKFNYSSLFIKTNITYSDADTFYINVKVENRGNESKKITPIIYGRAANTWARVINSFPIFPKGEKKDNYIFVSMRYISIYPKLYLTKVNAVMKPSFQIKNFIRGEGILYKVTGDDIELKKGEEISFSYAVAVITKGSEEELLQHVNGALQKNWEEIEKSSRKFYKSFIDSLPQPELCLDEKEKRAYAYAAWLLRHNSRYPTGKFNYTIIVPAHTFYDALWIWDAAFHVLALREINVTFAQNHIIQFCERQDPTTGMIYNFYTEEGHKIDPPVSLAPFLSWAALSIYEFSEDEEFLEKVYPCLSKFHNWWYEYRDADKDGLAEYTHAYESGWDSSPRWDKFILGIRIPRNPFTHISVEAVDLNSILYIDALTLAKMAKILGQDDLHWIEKAEQIKERIEKNMYDNKTGLYFDTQLDGEMIKIKTPACFMPLWAKIASKEKADYMIQRYLLNESEFLTPMPFPTVSRSEKTYMTDDYWRGNNWLHISFLMLEVLHKYGYDEEADAIAKQIIAHMSRAETFGENFNPETGETSGHTDNCSWGAAIYIEICLKRYKEDILENGLGDEIIGG